jgi:hypothetical protein
MLGSAARAVAGVADGVDPGDHGDDEDAAAPSRESWFLGQLQMLLPWEQTGQMQLQLLQPVARAVAGVAGCADARMTKMLLLLLTEPWSPC